MKIRGNTIGTNIKPEKTVVKCENLTEEEKAIARANIGAASEEVIGMIDATLTSEEVIGMIDATLNTIIAQQEEIIGTDSDAPTITFYVHNFAHTAEEDMTFEQWIGSKYDRDGFGIGPDGTVLDEVGRRIYTSDDELAYVKASDKIIPEYRYIIRLN